MINLICAKGRMKVYLNNNELSHLIKKAPFYHTINVGFGNGAIYTTKDSWEYKELTRFRKELARDAEK